MADPEALKGGVPINEMVLWFMNMRDSTQGRPFGLSK